MKKKIICFTINSYSQAKEIIVESKKNTIFPIIYIKYHIANGFGIEWIKALNRILIDFHGYKLFHQSYFNKKYISDLFLKLMRREHRYYYLVRVGEYIKNKEEWIKIKSYLDFYNYNKFQIFIIKYFGKFNFLIYILRILKRTLNL